MGQRSINASVEVCDLMENVHSKRGKETPMKREEKTINLVLNDMTLIWFLIKHNVPCS